MLRFGTDGVRGHAETDLEDPLVVALGRAAARVLGGDGFVIGGDTRQSRQRIEQAFRFGVTFEGGSVTELGVLPTPGIAYFSQLWNVPAAVVSASHNPWYDNGIKLLAAGGRKLADRVEAEIEQELDRLVDEPGVDGAIGSSPLAVNVQPYIDHLVGALDGRRLDGLRVVLDCANGAASEIGPQTLTAAGADVIVLHAEPDGRNINEACGSTYPESLRQAVRDLGADIGLALDGDADRVIGVDERGEIVDGDQIMTALALDMKERAALTRNAIVVTVMSNLGLRRALSAAGIGIVETPVGDRNVLVALEEHGLELGGEQSGHVIVPRLATTGDGLLTGLLLSDLAVRSGRPVSALAAQMERFPQVLANVRVAGRPDLAHAAGLWSEVDAVEAELGDRGRVLVRTSGTEPLVRVMVEAETEHEADLMVGRLKNAVEIAFPADQTR